MKKTILFALAICTTFALKAGDFKINGHGGSMGGDSKLTIGISVGAALPMSAYGMKAKNTSNDSTVIPDGFASTGFHFDVSAGYQIAGPVGAMILVGGNMNSFDAATYSSSSVYNIQSPSTFTSTNYLLIQTLVGPYLSFGSDNFKFNIRALVGLMMLNYPTGTETTTFAGQNYTDVSSGKEGNGFGYQFGAGIKYNFNDKMGLLVNVDYAGSSITYTGYTEQETTPAGSNTHTNTTLKDAMSVGLVTTTVGIAFNL